LRARGAGTSRTHRRSGRAPPGRRRRSPHRFATAAGVGRGAAELREARLHRREYAGGRMRNSFAPVGGGRIVFACVIQAVAGRYSGTIPLHDAARGVKPLRLLHDNPADREKSCFVSVCLNVSCVPGARKKVRGRVAVLRLRASKRSVIQPTGSAWIRSRLAPRSPAARPPPGFCGGAKGSGFQVPCRCLGEAGGSSVFFLGGRDRAPFERLGDRDHEVRHRGRARIQRHDRWPRGASPQKSFP